LEIWGIDIHRQRVVREVFGGLVAADDGYVAFDGDMSLGFAPGCFDYDEEVELTEDLEGFCVDQA